MTDKEIIINGVDVSEWTDEEVRYKFEKHSPKAIRQIAFDLYKQLERKEQEYEDLRRYQNKCCEEFELEKQALLEKYNQMSINFHNGYYCNIERCSSLKAKEQECYELKEQLKRKEENYQKLMNKSNKYIHNLVDENVQDISNLARQLEQFKAENDLLRTCHDNEQAKRRKYEQTLIEIKKIAEPYNDMSGNCVIVNVSKDMCTILQKISECEVKND